MQKGIGEQDFKRLHRRVVAQFRKKGVREDEALDLAQDTLLQVHKSFASFEERAELDTWVLSIAKNRWLQHCRNQGRMKRSAEEVAIETLSEKATPAGSAAGPEETTLARERLARTKAFIKKLPEPMQQAFILSIQGRKYRAIAVLLGVDENRVSSLIHQARSKLRRQFPT